jgi:anaerobic selenocysteine-containing dehydrogenase
LANGVIGDPPFVMKTVDDTVLKGTDVFIEVNPKTAGEHGLREGQLAMLSTPVGKARVKVHLFDGIMPGIVALPRGLGHTAFDDYLAGKGINFNELMGPVEDSVSGLDAAWGIRVKLAKA